MPPSDEETDSAARLPEPLLEEIDALEIPELEAVRSYVDQRIDSLQTPIETEIKSAAAGEILDIETHGAHATVRMHPSKPDSPGPETEITSLYRVQRERLPSGETSLHWSYLGDVNDSSERRCETCGRSIDEDAEVCPHCGSGETDDSENGG
ncbi:MAG: hypothetical protein ACI8UR_001272 [Natronomonas sp.]|jgi:hypothetical protein|uniref:zinc ribbon domain-containing protein n=1 Tax=Natronomonas sp. TaxID=2184060 RepID=UPI00398A4021